MGYDGNGSIKYTACLLQGKEYLELLLNRQSVSHAVTHTLVIDKRTPELE